MKKPEVVLDLTEKGRRKLVQLMEDEDFDNVLVEILSFIEETYIIVSGDVRDLKNVYDCFVWYYENTLDYPFEGSFEDFFNAVMEGYVCMVWKYFYGD